MPALADEIEPRWKTVRAQAWPTQVIADELGAYGSHYTAIFQIAKRLGVHVEFARIDPDGELQIVRGRPYVRIKQGQARVRQRFTMGHELGHLLLHPLGTHYRDTITAEPSDWYECEANRFSACLLMPYAAVMGLKYDQGLTPHEMAKVMQVSTGAMEIRLAGMVEGRQEY